MSTLIIIHLVKARRQENESGFTSKPRYIPKTGFQFQESGTLPAIQLCSQLVNAVMLRNEQTQAWNRATCDEPKNRILPCSNQRGGAHGKPRRRAFRRR